MKIADNNLTNENFDNTDYINTLYYDRYIILLILLFITFFLDSP
jgi:hypothetical protein